MLTDLQTILLAVAGALGAIVAAALGWLESGEPFNARQFTSSLLRALVAGLLFAATKYVGVETITAWEYILAFIGGAGVDVLGNRAAGAVVSNVQQAVSSLTSNGTIYFAFHVYDPKGAAIAGANVTLVGNSGKSYQGKTDGTGAVKITLPSQEFPVLSWNVSATGYKPGSGGYPNVSELVTLMPAT